MAKGNFKRDITKFIEKAKENGDRFLRGYTMDLMELIVTRTPVDTGFARSSWWVSINSKSPPTNPPNAETYKSGAGDKTGNKAVETAQLQIRQAKAGDTVYLMNNCKYIRRLEYDGHSKQAPEGFVRITLAQSSDIAKKVLARLERT